MIRFSFFILLNIGLLLFAGCNISNNKVKGTDIDGEPKMEFETKQQSFNDIKQDDVVGITYKFTNNGDAPLIINDVQKGCGCTQVNYPKNAILPGEKGVVEVIFDSSGFSGKQYKSITVYSNDPSGAVQLSFTTNVVSNY